MKVSIRFLALNGLLAAVYAVVTLLTAGFAYGPIQFRLAEALCLLPMLLPQSVWGVTLGCLIANAFSPVSALDMLVGTAATLLGCLWVRRVRSVWLAPLTMTLTNTLLVGAMLAFVYTPDSFWAGFVTMGAQVAVGELAVGYALGVPLLLLLRRSGAAERLR